MTDRTTINVDKENHTKANMVKEIHGDTWPEVLEFYWKHRGNGYLYDKDEPVEEVVGREVPQSSVEQDTDALRHQLERNYEAIVEATNAAQSADKKLGEMRQ